MSGDAAVTNGLKSMQFDKTVNLGNLVSWALLLLAAGGLYTKMDTNQNTLQRDFDQRKVYVDTQLAKGTDALQRVQQLERDQAAATLVVADHTKRLDLGYRERRDSEQVQANAIQSVDKNLALTNTKVDGLASDFKEFRADFDSLRREISPRRRDNSDLVPPRAPEAVVPASTRQAKRSTPQRLRTAGLTRALERMGGRPYFRGRYWASLSRRY